MKGHTPISLLKLRLSHFLTISIIEKVSNACRKVAQFSRGYVTEKAIYLCDLRFLNNLHNICVCTYVSQTDLHGYMASSKLSRDTLVWLHILEMYILATFDVNDQRRQAHMGFKTLFTFVPFQHTTCHGLWCYWILKDRVKITTLSMGMQNRG